MICEQAPNHGSYFAYARLIARVTLNLVLKAMDGGRDASAAVDKSITGEGVHRHDGIYNFLVIPSGFHNLGISNKTNF